MRKQIQCFVVLFTLLTLLSELAFSANELFRSVASGNWNSNSTWEMSINGGGSWFAATSTPDNTSNTITIRSPHIVTVTADITADQLVVDGGGQISIDNTIILTILDGSGTDLTLNSGATASGAGTVHTQGPNNNLFILAGSNFNVTLRVLNGATVVLDPSSPFKSILYGAVIIDSGAIFDVVAFGYFVQANGNVTNNGTIRGHASTFIVKGSSMVNNGSVIVHFLNFDSTTSISGTGTFTSNIIKVGTSGNVSLSGDVTFSPAQKVEIINGGVLNPNGNIFSIIANSNPSFDLHPGATVVNSGIFQTKGPSVVLHIRSGSSFNAPLKVNSGFAHALDPSPTNLAIFYGTITVDPGTNFHVGSPNYFTQANNIVTNNGTIDAPSATFIVKGSSLINNGSIKPTTLTFDSITSLSGTGAYTGTNIRIGASGNVSLSNNVTFTPVQKLEINTGGTLNPNGNTFTLYGNANPCFDLKSGGTVTNSGIFQTQGPFAVLYISSGSNFNAPLKVNSGTTHALDPTPSNLAIFYGTFTVDAGANFHLGQPAYVVQVNNNVINNGTIAGGGTAVFKMRGSSLINNGSINPANFHFDLITSISGTGTYTGTNIRIGASGNVSLLGNVTFSPGQKVEILSGGTLNPNGNIFTLYGNFNPSFDLQSGATVTNSGIFQTQGPFAVLYISSSSNFNAPLKVNSGTSHALDPTPSNLAIFYGTFTVDAGATFHLGQPAYVVQVNNNVTNNGTIGGGGSAVFKMRGSSLINNGSINPANFNFDSTTSISGTGTYTGTNMRIGSSGNVSLSNDVTFTPAQKVEIISGGILNPNGNIFTLFGSTNPSFALQSGATVTNSGIFQTQGPFNVLHLSGGSNFNAPLKVNSGTTHALDPTPTNLAIFHGTMTVDLGANFQLGQPAYVVQANNNVTNNGIIGGGGSAIFRMRGPKFTNNATINPANFNFDSVADTLLNTATGTISGGITRFFGAKFINNGNVTASTFNFETGAHTLQGTGFWSMEPQVLNGSTVTLLSDHQMSSLTIHSGGIFDISSRKLMVSRNGVPIGVIGSMITTGSTIEYNGSTGQGIATSNLNYNNLTINNNAGVNLPSLETVPGILTLTTGTFSIGGNLTMGNNATIVRQNGVLSGTPTFGPGVHVIYIGTNATASGTELPSSNTVLKNLTIDNSGGVTLSNPRTVNDSLFLMNGTFSNGSNLTLANGATINRRDGLLNFVPTFGTSVNVTYSGTTAVLTANEIPASATILNNLTINNTGGVTLSSNITANGILTFLNGLLHLGSNILTAGTSSTVGGTPSNSSMIVASGAGTVRKNYNSTGSFLFPVGDNIGTTEYSPITLNFVSGTFGSNAYAEVNIKNVNHPNNQSPEHYLNRYWTVTQNNITSFSCGVTGSYVDADVTGNEQTMWTGSWNGSSWTLLNQADALNNQISGTVASFSDFTGGRKTEMGGPANTFFAPGNFSDPTKWTSEKVPLSTDAAIIAANCVVDVTFPNLSSLTINSGVTLDMSTFELPNIATIINNGTIKTQNAGTTPLPSGITYLGTIEYNATGAQTVVNSTYTNLTASGSGNKNMNGSFTVESSLNLNGGSLSIGANTLTINGAINEGGGTLTGGLTSNITFGGTAPNYETTREVTNDVFIKNRKDELMLSTNLPAVTLNDLTINRGSGIGLTGNVTVEGMLALEAGALSINANTMTLNGSINITGGSLTGGTTSNLIIGGSGTSILIPSVSLNDLTLNRASGASLSGALTINGTLVLTVGTFMNGSNLTLVNGATVDRKEGTLNSAPTFGMMVNVIYSGTTSLSTGNEIPASPTVLNNLTINNPGSVTISGNTTANGILTFLDGLLFIGSNNLTFGASSSVGGTPSSSNMVVASGAGAVKKNFTGTGSFLFPVGDDIGTTEYSPITLNFVSGTFGGGAYAEVNIKNVKQPNNQSSEHYLNRYWTVTQNDITSFSCGVTGVYVDADIIGNELTMWTGSWNGSSWTLLNQADALNNQISGTVASFSDFTGGRKTEMGGTTNTFVAAGNFSDPTKWSNEKVPLSGDAAIIAANCLVDVTFPNLSSLTVNSGVTLDMATFELPTIATLTNNGTIKTQNTSTTPLPSGITYLGTIEYNAADVQTVVNSTYTNLTTSGSGNKNMNGSFTVESSLNLNGGSLSIGANTLTINGSINVGGGTLMGGLSSNIVFGGTAPNDKTTNGVNSKVFVKNDKDELMSSTNLPAVTLNNLTINRGLGIGLSGNVTVEGTLALQSGSLTIGSNNLTFGASSAIGGTPSSSNMVVASAAGTVRKNFTGTGSFLFPVGDDIGTTEYSPITLNFVSGTFGGGAYAEVNIKNVKQPNNQSSEHYLNRYWTVTQNDITSFSCGVTGVYVDADIIGNELTMWTGSWNGSSWTLLNQADALNNQISGTVASFSDFTGGRKTEMGGTTNTFVAAGSFSDPTKWSNEKVPLSGDAAIIAANCLVDVTFPNLSSLTVNSGVTLDMATFELPTIATLTNNGTIKTQNTSTTPLPSGITYLGTIEYNAADVQTVVNSTYTNLTTSGSGNKNMNGSFTVESSLNLNGGSLSIGANTLTINGSINVGGGTLMGGLSSNIVFGGTAPNDKTTNGVNSKVFVKNDKDELMSSTNLPAVTLNNLTINRGLGIGLSGNVTVEGTLALQSGSLTIGSNNLTFGASSAIGGTPSSSNMVVASAAGTVRKNFTGTGSFLFPVGDDIGTTEYSPITLNFVSGTFGAAAYAEVNIKNVKQPNNQSPTPYLNRYWTVTQNNITSFSCGVTGSYLDADIVGDELVMWGGRWNGSSWTLLNQADASNNQISGTVASFSDFTGGRKSDMGGGANSNTFIAVGNFSDPTKWSNGNVPIAGDTAIIAANCTVNVTVPNISSLKVNNGVILNMTTFKLPAIGIINNNGTIKTQNTSTTPLPSGITYLGTIEYNAAGVQTVVNSTYTNLTISGSGNKNMNGSFTVESSMNLNGGSLSIGANTLTINGSIIAAGGTLTGGLSSNIIFGGTAPNDLTSKEELSEVFIKNAKDELMLSTNLPAVTLNNLTINRGSGIGLSGNVTVEGILDLQNGSLTIGVNNLRLGALATVDGAVSNSKMIVASGTGKVRKIFTANRFFIFPVGDNIGTAEYSPIALYFERGTFGSGAYAEVNIKNVKHPNNQSSTPYLKRYWTVTQNNITSFTCWLVGVYDNADVVGNEENLWTGSWNGSSWKLHNQAIAEYNIISGTVKSFSDFTGGRKRDMSGPTNTFMTSGSFSDSTKWSDEKVPLDGDDVIIAANCVVEEPLPNLSSLTINSGVILDMAAFELSNITTITNYGTIRNQNSNTSAVELSSFGSSINRNNITLNWTTTKEINNSGFDIERKLATAPEWLKVNNVSGNGNSDESHNYTYTERVNAGKYYYRLKQINFNGDFNYFNLENEVEVLVPGTYNLSQNYPNPFNPLTTIEFDIPELSNVKLTIYDLTGKEVMTLLNTEMQPGSYDYKWDASSFASGIYFYRINAGSFVETKRMLLVK